MPRPAVPADPHTPDKPPANGPDAGSGADTAQPDRAGGDTAQPDRAGADTTRSDRAAAGTTQPDQAGADTTQPDQAEVNAVRPGQPEAGAAAGTGGRVGGHRAGRRARRHARPERRGLVRRVGGALGWGVARTGMGLLQGLWRLAAWRRTLRGAFVAPLLVTLLVMGLAGVVGVLIGHVGTGRPVAAPLPGPVPTVSQSADTPTVPQPPVPVPSRSTARPVDGLNGWAQQLSPLVGIPVPALKAYGSAQLRIALTLPGCHLSWTTLAGIGKVESGHGTAKGSSLTETGLVTPMIVGPALDGTGGRPLVRDSDLGYLDGDKTFDHAIGPMQFLPASWVSYQADGDADGRDDPADLNDAALAAGNFLCAQGRDLATPAAWSAAVLAYNPAQAYAQSVFAAADSYGRASRARPPTLGTPTTPNPATTTTRGSTT